MYSSRISIIAALAAMSLCRETAGQSALLQSSDLFRLRSVVETAFSPDGKRIAYGVQNNGRSGRPYTQIWIVDVAPGQTTRLTDEKATSGSPRWSPDGQWIAYWGGTLSDEPAPAHEPVVEHELASNRESNLMIARADGSGQTLLVTATGTNHDLPRGDKDGFSWSPDSKQIAFLSATPGPETSEASGDPRVITRYQYKPTAGEGRTRFTDNRRLHISIVDVETQRVRQLTDGIYHEHSIDWSPNGEEIAFVSNREPDPDRFLNNDLFTVRVADGSIRRVLATESVEYMPRWSPDGKTIAYQGTKRGLASSESFMEDTHTWVIDAEGTEARELGASIDNRQGPPVWEPDGSAIYATVQERGNVRLYRFPISGSQPQAVVNDRGQVGSFSLATGGEFAYSFHSPTDTPQLYSKIGGAAAKRLTDLNSGVLGDKQIAEIEAMTFLSHDHQEVEAFLTHPLRRTADSRHPLIAVIKGGPHGQQGPVYDHRAQVYAARGWATLMVNYRGSTGYGQKYSDAIFGVLGSNCGEPKDVLFGVGAALRRNPYLDPDRLGIEGGSCGGQIAGWLITQTSSFKAAIPYFGIYNQLAFNYMSYYHDYMAVEHGAFPHQDNMMDLMWEWSALKHAAKVKTPTMLVHGENDNDVPIAESEMFYTALKDVGVETILVRYPREGHGIREPKHVVDLIDRSIAWYEKHFPEKRPATTPTPTAGAK